MDNWFEVAISVSVVSSTDGDFVLVSVVFGWFVDTELVGPCDDEASWFEVEFPVEQFTVFESREDECWVLVPFVRSSFDFAEPFDFVARLDCEVEFVCDW